VNNYEKWNKWPKSELKNGISGLKRVQKNGISGFFPCCNKEKHVTLHRVVAQELDAYDFKVSLICPSITVCSSKTITAMGRSYFQNWNLSEIH
jgi:hypothetical protein